MGNNSLQKMTTGPCSWLITWSSVRSHTLENGHLAPLSNLSQVTHRTEEQGWGGKGICAQVYPVTQAESHAQCPVTADQWFLLTWWREMVLQKLSKARIQNPFPMAPLHALVTPPICLFLCEMWRINSLLHRKEIIKICVAELTWY